MTPADHPVSAAAFRLPFRDRREAGRILASHLYEYAGRASTVVAAIPRGGVVVAAEIAAELHLPLTVFLIRKLGVPGQEELAMGAITSGGMRLMNRRIVDELALSESEIEAAALREARELERRERLYTRGRGQTEFREKTVILVDDGIATGASIRLAMDALRKQGASRIILAVPVGPPESIAELRQVADEVLCLAEPSRFVSVSNWYEDFQQVSDHEVCQLLDALYARQFSVRSA
ncbi:MAG: phosphoribosyltransferase [Actinomycetota bacterium]